MWFLCAIQPGRGRALRAVWSQSDAEVLADATRWVTGYQATRGWDPVTGLGSPDAQVLIPLLARYASR